MNQNRKKRILLVEDEAITALAESKQLESYGYETITASSGEKAIELVQSESAIDLVLMDIDLGNDRMDGTEAASYILQEKELPVVFLSNHTEPEVVEKTEKITSYGYVVKNSGITVLDASIKMAFRLFEEKQKVRLHQEELRHEKENLQQYIDVTEVLLVALNKYGEVVLINPKGCDILGYTKEEIIGKNWFDWFIQGEDLKEVKSIFEKVMMGLMENAEYHEQPVFCKDGTLKLMAWHNSVLRNEEGEIIGTFSSGEDITLQKELEEIKAAETARQEVLLELHQNFGSHNERIYDFILEASLKLTRSCFSFFGFMDSEESAMTIHAWSRDAMMQCRILDKPMHFPVSEAGIWGDCVRQRKAVIYNDYEASIPSKHGLPEGHVPIKRFMGFPVFERGKIVAVAAVANKKEPYTSRDADSLVSIFERMWTMLNRQESEHKLQERVKELDCLHEMADIVEKQNDIDEILSDMIWLLKKSWQYPDITEVRIKYKGETYSTGNYRDTKWKQSAELSCNGKQCGAIDVCYISEMPDQDEGPFQKEERKLLNTVAERLGRIIERISISREFEDLFQALNEGVLFVDAAGIVQKANTKAATICGYASIDELIGTPMENLYVFPEKRFELLQSLERNDNKFQNFELELKRKDGTAFLASCNIHLIRASRGRMSGTFGFFRDITRQKKEEREFSDTTLLLREAQKLGKSGSWNYDANTKVTWWSEGLFEIFGRDKEKGTPSGENGEWLEQIHPEDRPSVQKAIREALKNNKPYEVEYRIYRENDSRLLTILARGKVIRDDVGQPLRMIGVAQDITEQKIVEEQLRESQAYLQKLVERSPMPIVITDENQDIEYYNEKFTETFGYTLEDISTAEQWWLTCYPDEEYRKKAQNSWTKAIQKAMQENREIDMQVWDMIRKDGSRRSCEFNMVPLGKRNLIVMTDITESKRKEEELQNALGAKQALLRELQHRVKNSFLSIESFINLKLESTTPEIQDALKEIVARIKALGELYTLLQETNTPGRVDLGHYCQKVLSSAFRDSDNIELKSELDSVETDTKTASTTGLILTELVTNSIKHAFTGKKPGVITTVLEKNNESILLTVRDNGVGISNKVDPKSPDTMGLMLVKMMVESLNGRLDIKRSKGTTVSVSLPV